MASFDGSAFDSLGFDPAAFDLEETPGALYGAAAGSGSASATLTAIAFIAGSASGSSTAQAYLELDGGPPATAVPTGAPVFPRRRPRIPLALPAGPIEDDEALLLLELF